MRKFVPRFRKILTIAAILSLLTGIAVFFLTGGSHHNILPLLSVGEKYLGEEDFRQAELQFSRAIRIDDHAAKAYYGRARANIGLGEIDDSKDDLTTVKTLAPEQTEKVDWMIDKLDAGEGEDLIRIPYRTNVTSDEEFEMLNFSGGERDVVLVLDTSGSMEGGPLETTKNASKSFVDRVLEEGANVGLVSFNYAAEEKCPFTDDSALLKDSIDALEAGGGTATATGLQQAYDMLEASNARRKFIVLMSDGESGDDPVPLATDIKEEGVTIYTLGFFGEDTDSSYVQSVMEAMASEGCHYEVDNEESLNDFFNDIAQQINGQKYYYIRIACPVDVEVESGDEELKSKGAETSQRTEFGTLTFEDAPQDEEAAMKYDEEDEDKRGDTDDRIKVLRLKADQDYQVRLYGNGKGKMTYTIGFMDDDGEYSDMRTFKSIPISRDTEIMTQAESAPTTTMEVDDDGDGEVDTTYRAAANSRAEEVVEEVKEVPVKLILTIVLIAAGVAVLIIVLVVVTKARKKRNG